MKVTDFSFDLPESLIATKPVVPRDGCRLLVLHKNGTLEHRIFHNLPEYLEEGDLLLLNNTRVLPARLTGEKNTGGKIEILLVRELEPETWEILSRERYSGMVYFNDELSGEIPPTNGSGKRAIKFMRSYDTSGNNGIMESVFRLGQMPLPPYIKRRPLEEDREWYQTVYAEDAGSIAAPTAGLHFTDELMHNIRGRGVSVRFITLHIGRGTFKPVTVEDIREHSMDAEYFEMDKETIDTIMEAKALGKRVLAAGTTTTRAIEGYLSGRYKESQGSGLRGQGSDDNNQGAGNIENNSALCTPHSAFKKIRGFTDIFIYPGYEFRAVDSLITNFHLPGSTPMMLTSAFCNRERLMKTYESAVSMGYRFFSYGDAMLIL
ncbi:MAG: tRNA preQ1(34) S-adenosylmethionine ribosyltransferase-isomerase QueA [Nitrospirota bacterium]